MTQESKSTFGPFAYYQESVEILREYCGLKYVTKETEDEYLHILSASVKALRGFFGRSFTCAIVAEEDSAAFERLPAKFTIYRGYYEPEKREGISWSLSRKVAEGFAYAGHRTEGAKPCVVVGTCLRNDVIAYSNEREEQEIIINPRKVRAIENIKVRRKPEFPVSAEPLDVLLADNRNTRRSKSTPLSSSREIYERAPLRMIRPQNE